MGNSNTQEEIHDDEQKKNHQHSKNKRKRQNNSFTLSPMEELLVKKWSKREFDIDCIIDSQVHSGTIRFKMLLPTPADSTPHVVSENRSRSQLEMLELTLEALLKVPPFMENVESFRKFSDYVRNNPKIQRVIDDNYSMFIDKDVLAKFGIRKSCDDEDEDDMKE